jgi:4-amino-4-deoxy-L-arabinose transferase-like glycosyltransferase
MAGPPVSADHAAGHRVAAPIRAWPWSLPASVALAATALYVAVLGVILPVASSDLGIAAVFSTDEALSGRIVARMVAERTLDPSGFFAYGALYHELGALAAALLAPLAPPGQAALIGLRIVALAGGAAALLLTFRLGAALFGPWAGLVALALVAASPELALWSVTAHPDTTQLALLVAGLLACLRVRARPGGGRVALAAALAGLAFATKYGGVLVLPMLGLATVLGLVEAGLRGRRLAVQLLRYALLAGAVFAAAFLVTNPYAVVEWRRFVTQVRAELSHARAGHVLVGDAPALRWLLLVAGPLLAGPVTAALAAGSIAAGVWRRARRVRRPGLTARAVAVALDDRALIGLWACGYLTYLVLFTGYQAPRYALPLLPAVCVLAAGAVAALPVPARPRIAVALIAVASTALVAAPALADIYRERLDRGRRLEADPRVQAGRWLDARLPSEAAVIVDAYTYVPPRLRQARTTFGLTADLVATTRPVVIVTNDAIRGRFADRGLAGRYVDGPGAFALRADAYDALEAGRLGCYRAVLTLADVTVWADERALATGALTGCGTAAAQP